MANTGHKGIDVRQSANRLLFRALLQDSAGALVTSGTTSLYLYELQSDGTLSSYDFSDNTFKTTGLTTETASLTHRTGNNGGTNTGIWSYALATVSGFTLGAVYLVRVKNTGASPTDQVREFQFGSAEGDLSVTSTFYLKTDPEEWKGGTIPAVNVTGVPKADVVDWLGSAPNALQSGRVDAYAGALAAAVIAAASFTAGAIDASTIATNALGALELASDAASEIADAVAAETLTELSGVPAASPTLAQAVMWLYMAARNLLTSTATQQDVHNSAGSTVGSATVADDGTQFSRGKYS